MESSVRRSLLAFLKYGAATATAGSVALHLWTREARFDRGFGPKSDPALFHHVWTKKINPVGNKGFHDSCVRVVPFSQVRSDLLDDALAGGSKLVEQLAAGVWGRYGMPLPSFARYCSGILLPSFRDTSKTSGDRNWKLTPDVTAFTPQRRILQKIRKDNTNQDDLWDREQLLQSTYEDGM